MLFVRYACCTCYSMLSETEIAGNTDVFLERKSEKTAAKSKTAKSSGKTVSEQDFLLDGVI
jgi:hypothetical protein